MNFYVRMHCANLKEKNSRAQRRSTFEHFRIRTHYRHHIQIDLHYLFFLNRSQSVCTFSARTHTHSPTRRQLKLKKKKTAKRMRELMIVYYNFVSLCTLSVGVGRSVMSKRNEEDKTHLPSARFECMLRMCSFVVATTVGTSSLRASHRNG